jgi:hypothetical protein
VLAGEGRALIPLVDDGIAHRVRVVLGPAGPPRGAGV